VEENLKGRLVLILGILSVIFLLLWISSCNDVRKFRSAKDKEMNLRLDSEQKRDEYMKQKSSLEEKILKVESALDEEKATLDSTRKALSQEQMVSNSLKSELEKINKLKEQLENDLKNALIKNKAAVPEKPKK